MIGTIIMANLAVVQATEPVRWDADMIWGCKFQEEGREPFLLQGVIASAVDDANGGSDRLRALLIKRDDSGRYLNKGARGLYFRAPEPGMHWAFLDGGKGDILVLDFTHSEKLGTATLHSGDRKEPFADAKCKFQEKAQ